MSVDIALASVKYAMEHSDDELAITFYGGEPLLCFDVIKQCVEYSQKLNLSANKNLSYSLTTNLTLMTKEIAEYVASIDGFTIVCSIDGPENYHDEYRKYINGKGSFKDVFRGFKILVDAYNKYNRKKGISINSVFCPPYVKEKANSIFNFWKSIEWIPEYIDIDLTYPSEGSLDDNEHINDLKKDLVLKSPWEIGINPLLEEYLDKFYKEEIIEGNLERMLLGIHKRYLLESPTQVMGLNGCCIPGARRLYISMLGDFYICEKIGNSPNIGNIKDGIDFNSIKKYYVNDYILESIDDCSNCWAIRNCGICYAPCYSNEGMEAKKKKVICEVEKKQILRDLSLYHQLLESHPEKLNYLNEIILV